MPVAPPPVHKSINGFCGRLVSKDEKRKGQINDDGSNNSNNHQKKKEKQKKRSQDDPIDVVDGAG